MSSTTRAVRPNSDDFFATPAWVVEAILPHILPAARDTIVLDPCCGEGAILDVVRGRSDRPHPTVGIELDTGRADTARAKGHLVTTANALEVPWPSGVQTVIQNPPFNDAERFVRKGIAHAFAPCGHQECVASPLFADACRGRRRSAVLLRLAFLESAKRIPLHREHKADVYPLAYRPSFTPNGKHDSCAYAWFVWGPGVTGKIQVLDAKPPARPRAPRAPRVEVNHIKLGGKPIFVHELEAMSPSTSEVIP